MQRDLGKPIRTVLRWQLLTTAALTIAAGFWAGAHGALSAALGGSVSFCAGLAAAVVASLGKTNSAGGIVLAALSAEAVKIGLIAILLLLVFATYRDIVVIAFLGTFVATALIFAMAFLCATLENNDTLLIMAAGKELTPTEYIGHHLTHGTKSFGEGGFWSVNFDSVSVSILLGFLGLGFLWWVVKGATAGVPGKRQAFVELLFEFIDDQAKGIFHHGDRNKFVAPMALTVFVWVLLLNAMDFLPVDIVALATHGISEHGFRIVPTADINTTFALALTVWLLMIFFSIAAKGFGGWMHELFCSPFGKWMFPFNLLFNAIEYLSKPLSHSLRLYGNMYAGEIIFLLLWMWAATGLVGTLFGSVLALGWAIFHILIVALQAYVFMMLTIVYLSMAHEHHG